MGGLFAFQELNSPSPRLTLALAITAFVLSAALLLPLSRHVQGPKDPPGMDAPGPFSLLLTPFITVIFAVLLFDRIADELSNTVLSKAVAPRGQQEAMLFFSDLFFTVNIATLSVFALVFPRLIRALGPLRVAVSAALTLFIVPAMYAVLARKTRSPKHVSRLIEQMRTSVGNENSRIGGV